MGLADWFSRLFHRGAPSDRTRPHCRDCGTPEGALHEPFCTQEACPWCGGQLAACGCIVTVLQLNDDERRVVEEYVDDSVEPLCSIVKRWEAALEKKGRISFIDFPTVCAKCGALRPDFFKVSDVEWRRYIEPAMQNVILCRGCFDYIRKVVDSARSEASSE